ncbi:MAG: hypothetical protein CM1200mP28_04030 [Deltaproteobacteria bacterium]|nr:MAG: hypothetical protein CM1200mP28_04030 [Deltaproteobacteria bacterium]
MSISTFGKFQAEKGAPSFIQVGETTRTEILETLGNLLFTDSRGRETYLQFERGIIFFFMVL